MSADAAGTCEKCGLRAGTADSAQPGQGTVGDNGQCFHARRQRLPVEVGPFVIAVRLRPREVLRNLSVRIEKLLEAHSAVEGAALIRRSYRVFRFCSGVNSNVP